MPETTPDIQGLSPQQVLDLQKQYGKNMIEEKKRSFISRFGKLFITPMSLMFIVAGVLSYFAGETSDAIVIMVLFLTNIGVSVWHEAKADNAIEALREKLTILIHTFRDGNWQNISSIELVPGDIIELTVGDVVPADITFLTAKNLSINESIITGESMAKEKKAGDTTYSGAFVSTGLTIAKVNTIGNKTYFGTTLSMIDNTKRPSQLEKDIYSISKFLSLISVFMIVILSIALGIAHEPFLKIATLDVSMLIAGIPVALPTIMTLIISIGVVELSKKSVIVRRLSSLEDLANVNLLLSDKTGTLTENKIKVTETHFLALDIPQADIFSLAYSAAPVPRLNPIDAAIDEKAIQMQAQKILVTDFIPGDSIRKRTTVLLEYAGKKRVVSLGAPQTIRELSTMNETELTHYDSVVTQAAQEGFRVIAVAMSDDEKEEKMKPLVLFFLADAIRSEAKDTIAFMHDYGIDVKMVTGDGHDVAAHVAKELGIVGDIFVRSTIENDSGLVKEKFEQTAGFAEVFPKDKYDLVNMARTLPIHHVVAVTGDGVNDVPPIKAADVGFAVANAVDALKGAADIVLTKPGIAVIRDAIIEARKIFTRLYNYSLYRISESFRLIITIAVIGIIFGTYPLTPVQIILIALLNDVPIISLAFDRVAVSHAPANINARERFTLSTLYGLTGIANSLVLLWIAIALHIPWALIQTIFFLKLTVSGHMLVYVAHTERPWYKFLPSSQVIWATILTQILASLMCYFGTLTTAIPLTYIIFVWIWAFFWMQIAEVAKRFNTRFLEHKHATIG